MNREVWCKIVSERSKTKEGRMFSVSATYHLKALNKWVTRNSGGCIEIQAKEDSICAIFDQRIEIYTIRSS